MSSAFSLKAPYNSAMEAAVPLLPTAIWSAPATGQPMGSLTLQGGLPAPLLVAGEMLVGYQPGPVWGTSESLGPLTVLRSISAKVAADKL